MNRKTFETYYAFWLLYRETRPISAIVDLTARELGISTWDVMNTLQQLGGSNDR